MRQSDSEKEFERLVTEHRATIYTVCYMFSKDADEVADLFREVPVNLWRGMGGFEGRSDVRTWIYRVSLKKTPACATTASGPAPRHRPPVPANAPPK